MIKWFSLAAQKIVQGKMKLSKQTQNLWIDIRMVFEN